MVLEQLAFDDIGSYTQWWKSKLAEVLAWGIKPLTSEKRFDTLTTPLLKISVCGVGGGVVMRATPD